MNNKDLSPDTQRTVDNLLYNLRGKRYFHTFSSFQLACYNGDESLVGFDDYLVKKGIINDRNQLTSIILEEKRIFGYTTEISSAQTDVSSIKKDGWKELSNINWSTFIHQKCKTPAVTIYFKVTDIVEPLTGNPIFVLGNDTSYDYSPGRSTKIKKVITDYCEDDTDINSFGKIYKDVDIDKMVEALHTFIPLVNASLEKVNSVEKLKIEKEIEAKKFNDDIVKKFKLN